MKSRAPAPLVRRYARRRAACLIGVHLLIAAHVVHWKVAGRTLAPLELNEVMHTLELGVVTAGFLLMATAVASVALFGRFFCSWGCHLLALQDLAAWVLGRLGLRPSPVRARWLAWVPAGAALYMFVWPQAARLATRAWPAAAGWIGARPDFRLRLQGDAEGWASLLTTDFARNLPGPGMAVLTFVVCGFVAVWLLGTRTFCAAVCPYGAVFSFADRFAPRRIVLAGDCTACGRCTAVCDSGIRVYDEVKRSGRVTSGACLKDLDCVSVCPTGGLVYGGAPPTLFGRRGVARRTDLTRGEEWGSALVFAFAFAALRGLYRAVPFLLALALAVVVAMLSIVAARLARRPEVRLQGWLLAKGGQFTARGWAFAAGFGCVALLVVHGGWVRALEAASDRVWRSWSAGRASGSFDGAATERLLDLLDRRARWGLRVPADVGVRQAEALIARAGSSAAGGDLAAAERDLRAAATADPASGVAAYDHGVILAALGRETDAIAAFRESLRRAPDDAESLNNLAFLLWRRGEAAEAELLLRAALRHAPGFGRACANLAALLSERGFGAAGDRDLAPCAAAAQ